MLFNTSRRNFQLDEIQFKMFSDFGRALLYLSVLKVFFLLVPKRYRGCLHFVSCSDCSEKTEILNYSSLECTAVNFTLWGDEGAGSDTAIRQ